MIKTKNTPLTSNQKTDRRNAELLEACHRDNVPVDPRTGEVGLSNTQTNWKIGRLIMIENPNWIDPAGTRKVIEK